MSRPVLLLHGQPGSSRDWSAVIAAIGDRAQAIAIDRPGWDGGSAPTDLAGNGRAAVAELDRRGIEQAVVVGHSFGGAIAAWVAAFHPERTSALVLAAPAANTSSLLSVDRWLATPVAGLVMGAGILGTMGLILSSRFVNRNFLNEPGLDGDYLRTAGHRLLDPASWRAFYYEQRSLVRDLPVLEGRLQSISVPTRIVVGAADRLAPVSSARLLSQQIKGSELELIPGAGHIIPLRHPELVATAIMAVAE